MHCGEHSDVAKTAVDRDMGVQAYIVAGELFCLFGLLCLPLGTTDITGLEQLLILRHIVIIGDACLFQVLKVIPEVKYPTISGGSSTRWLCDG